MATATQYLQTKAQAAKAASRVLAKSGTEVKNKALGNIADALKSREAEILAANAEDYAKAKASGMSESMLDRLMLNSQRLTGIAADVRSIIQLPDPVGESFDVRILPNGIQLGKRRVPLGVIASIYESRPNVTIDISALCLKSGNAAILRGGHESVRSSSTLANIVRDSIEKAGLPADAVQYVDNPDRDLVNQMLKMRDYIDLLIPRGSESLIKFVRDNATMAVVAGGIGVCHTYVDASADLMKAKDIVFNAKVQRPTVCNALDTIIVHNKIAKQYLPMVGVELAKAGVEMHCDERSMMILASQPDLKLKPAVADDWGKEFLALTAAVKVVDSLDEALKHIETYGSGHSEAIITEDYSSAMRFLDEVDAAAVYVNASTRFTDGSQFGLGAEVGISTQKMHARGPMGLRELTSYKWIVMGTGQVRPG
ncbi:MAG: glutamate-5-semialdehyde dehydrogenase [Dehalococcoidia bacterium]|nr:glutamate-5-semialdehyde dehydrogenase [Dehalococcoidia bacterium]